MKTLILKLHQIFIVLLFFLSLSMFHANGVTAQKTWSLKVSTDYTFHVDFLSFGSGYDFEKNKKAGNHFLHFLEMERKLNARIRAGMYVGFGNESFTIKNDIYREFKDAELSVKNIMAGVGVSYNITKNVFAEFNYAKSFFTPTFTSGQFTVYNDGKIENLTGKKLNTVDGDILMIKGGVNIPFLKNYEAVICAGRRLMFNTNIIEDVFKRLEMGTFVQGGVRYYIL